MEKDVAIVVDNVSKQFNIDYNRSNTLKDMLLFKKKAKNVKKEQHEVLKNINLKIKKGETVALIGENGSGKSTLLKLMTKIIYPTSGVIQTYGKLTSLLELGAGFHIDFTGRENIYFNASIFGLTRKEIDDRIDEIVAFSELEEYIDNPVKTYSSGMYMRLAFSVAINVDAEILLIDEILAVGDQHFQEKCFKKLQELKSSDKTIVIVSHSLDVVKKLCDRAIWLYDGHVKMDDKADIVIENYLNQIALDHLEERKNAITHGQYSGMTYIDEPKNYQNFSIEEGSIQCHGWMICDDEKSVLRLSFDDINIEDRFIKRYKRLDVYKAFQTDYAGMVDVNQLGWKANIPIKNVEPGTHFLKVQCLNRKEEVLHETICEIILE